LKLNNKYLMLLALLVVLVALPFIVTNTYYLHLVNLIIVYSIIAIGLNLITGVTGQISLGHAAFWAIGAYTTAYITTTLGLSFWISLPLSILVAGAIGIIVGYFTLHLQGPYLAMATIGIGEITHQVLINWTSFSGGPSGVFGIPTISIFGFEINSEFRFYFFSLLFLVLVYSICKAIVNSRYGRSAIAIRENENAARAVGVNSTKVKILVFGVSTAIAGLAGALYAPWVNYISPENFTFAESLLFLTMIMMGGMGSIPASIVGTTAIVAMSELLREVEQYRLIIYALIIILVIVFFPKGIIGMIPEKFRKGVVYPDFKLQGLGQYSKVIKNRFDEKDKIVLKAEGITKKFGGLTAVNQVNLQVGVGEIRALIGPNGSGKSTFLNCLAGWYEIDGGVFTLENNNITKLPIYKRSKSGIARTFQNILLFNEMTVLENVLVAINEKNKREKQLVQDAYEILEFVGLLDKANEKVSNLPYGHQRSVEIARALALYPKILLLDEPAAGMNDTETAELMDLIYRIRDKGITVIVVEHDMKLVMGIADFITVLNQGQILAEGTPLDISKHEDVIKAYLGKEAVNAVS